MFKTILFDRDLETSRLISGSLKGYKKEYANLKSISNIDGLLEFAKEAGAGIVIADVGMVYEEGFSILKKISEQHPLIKFILYASFNETEHLQKCLEYDILDYLYKPIKYSELVRCIQRAEEYFKTIESRKLEDEQLISGYKNEISLYEEVFIRSWLKGWITDEKEIHDNFAYFKIDMQASFTVINIKIDQYRKIIQNVSVQEKHLLLYKIKNVVSRILAEEKFRLYADRFNGVTVILSSSKSLAETLELFEQVKDAIFERLKIKVTIGIGRTYESASNVRTSCLEADAALRNRFYLGYNTVISIHFAEPLNKITYIYPFEREQKLVYLAVIGEYESCADQLKSLINGLRKCGELPQGLLPKIIMNILISINRYASERGIDIQNQFSFFFRTKDILELNDLDDAYKYLKDALQTFCKYIVARHEESDCEMVQAAKDHMLKFYYQTFSLPDLARNLGTSPEYLEKAFFDRENVKIYDFAIKARLAEAKLLVQKTTLDDDVIAAKVGYNDARSLRADFKELEGQSFREFRHKYKPLIY